VAFSGGKSVKFEPVPALKAVDVAVPRIASVANNPKIRAGAARQGRDRQVFLDRQRRENLTFLRHIGEPETGPAAQTYMAIAPPSTWISEPVM
jgi:hypothetical protein